MATKNTKPQAMHVQIHMTGQGDWKARKEKIEGGKVIVFYRTEKKSSFLQQLNDRATKVMSGTTAAKKYLQQMDVNEKNSLLKDFFNPSDGPITKEGLNKYMQYLHACEGASQKADINSHNKRQVEGSSTRSNTTGTTVSFLRTEKSDKILQMIDFLKNNCDPRDEKKIIRYVNLAFDDLHHKKSIAQEKRGKSEYTVAIEFLKKIKIQNDSPEKASLEQIIKKLNAIKYMTPSKDPAVFDLKVSAAIEFISDINEIDKSELKKLISYIDIACAPPSSKKITEDQKKSYGEARLQLTLFSRGLDASSDLQKKIYALIDNLNLVIDGAKGNTAATETKLRLNQNLTLDRQIEMEDSRKEIIRQSIGIAVDNFYGLELAPKNSTNQLASIAGARLELRNLRVLADLPPEVNAELDVLIKAMNETIDRLKEQALH